jgi:hypothetical protein
VGICLPRPQRTFRRPRIAAPPRSLLRRSLGAVLSNAGGAPGSTLQGGGDRLGSLTGFLANWGVPDVSAGSEMNVLGGWQALDGPRTARRPNQPLDMKDLKVRGVLGEWVRRAIDAVRSGRQKEIEGAMADILTMNGPDRQKAIAVVTREALRRDQSGTLRSSAGPFLILAMQKAARPLRRSRVDH